MPALFLAHADAQALFNNRYGFLGGFCTAGLLGIGSQMALRRAKIYPEVVYQTTLRALQNDAVTHQKASPRVCG